MKIDPAELMGPREVADFLGVGVQAVSNLRTRGSLPEPVAVVRMGPLWTRSQIEGLAADRAARRLAKVERLERQLERLRSGLDIRTLEAELEKLRQGS